MSAYDTPTEKCPYCNGEMEADYVDNGIGMVQCGPYHCYGCEASEIGPELFDWYYKDREGSTLYVIKPGEDGWGHPVLKPGHPFSDIELETGFYKGRISPYANTVNGELVDHKEAKEMYNIGLLDEKKLGEPK
jgi:hypothetical protein